MVAARNGTAPRVKLDFFKVLLKLFQKRRRTTRELENESERGTKNLCGYEKDVQRQEFKFMSEEGFV